MYLANDLGHISTLALSRGCNQYKKKYLESFEISNSIKNRGEMNYFIEAFLSIMIDTLTQMNSELKEKDQLIKLAIKKLDQEPKLMSKTHYDIMFVLAQNHFFDFSSGLTVKDFTKIINKSDATIRKVIKELLDLSLIEQRGEKPAYFLIKQQYFES